MSLSIMPLLIVCASQLAAHPHHHQRQVQRPHQHEDGTTCSQACSKACPKGEACATVKVKRKIGKGFYSTPVDGH